MCCFLMFGILLFKQQKLIIFLKGRGIYQNRSIKLKVLKMTFSQNFQILIDYFQPDDCTLSNFRGERQREECWVNHNRLFFLVEMSHDYELNVIIHRKRIFFSSFVRDFSAIFCCPAGCSAWSPQKVFLTKIGPFPSHCLSSRIIIRTLTPLLFTV